MRKWSDFLEEAVPFILIALLMVAGYGVARFIYLCCAGIYHLLDKLIDKL